MPEKGKIVSLIPIHRYTPGEKPIPQSSGEHLTPEQALSHSIHRHGWYIDDTHEVIGVGRHGAEEKHYLATMEY